MHYFFLSFYFLIKNILFQTETFIGYKSVQRFMYFSDALGVLAELFSATSAPYECTAPSRLQQFDVLESTESRTSLRA